MTQRSATNINRMLAVVAGAVVLAAVGAGGAVAGSQIGSKQIADNSIRSRDVRDGTLQLRDVDPGTKTALRGPAGPAGADGSQGEPGAPAALKTVGFDGPVVSIPADGSGWVFAGPVAQIKTTDTYPRVVASASAPLGVSGGNSPQYAEVGMCYRPYLGGIVANFHASSALHQYFTTNRYPYAASATVVLAPNNYVVGLCVRNTGSSPISNNGTVSGWAQVTQ